MYSASRNDFLDDLTHDVYEENEEENNSTQQGEYEEDKKRWIKRSMMDRKSWPNFHASIHWTTPIIDTLLNHFRKNILMALNQNAFTKIPSYMKW